MSNGLDVALMKDPFGDWRPEVGDHHTDIAFGDPEWASFFFHTLKATNVDYIRDEGYEKYTARYEAAFRESLKDFPLLARIHEFYRDAFFASDEIDKLEEELRSVATKPLTGDGRAFLEGMLRGCRLAKEAGMGIRLLSS